MTLLVGVTVLAAVWQAAIRPFVGRNSAKSIRLLKMFLLCVQPIKSNSEQPSWIQKKVLAQGCCSGTVLKCRKLGQSGQLSGDWLSTSQRFHLTRYNTVTLNVYGGFERSLD